MGRAAAEGDDRDVARVRRHLRDPGHDHALRIQGDIDWTFAIALAIGVIPGARIGARFTIARDDRTLRYTVGAALGIIAVIYAVGEIIALLGRARRRAREHRVEHRRA